MAVRVGIAVPRLAISALVSLSLVIGPKFGLVGASRDSRTRNSQRNSNSDFWLIVPGKRIGKLLLGDTKDRFWQLFQRYEPGSDEYTYPCGNVSITELGHIEAASNPISAYAKNGHIYQISASGSLSRTADGITEYSSPQKVKRFYPGLEAYWLEHYRAVEGQSRDSIFWVDAKHGIAFQLDYSKDDHGRFVGEIYVFNPNENFQPLVCLRPPQVWKKIAPYSLEPPGQSPH
jgi:hypothetical protein